MKYLAIGTGLLAIIIAALLFMTYARTATAPGAVACGKDKQVCIDGSLVGRTGPSCTFTCPPVDESLFTGTTTLKMDIGQGATALGVTLTPFAIVEDSRCPVGTQCVQAGTVRVQVRISDIAGVSIKEVTLGKPLATAADTIVLTSVAPNSKSDDITKYSFAFTVSKNPGAPLYTASISGTVTLGPTCPVVKNPPDPKCADKRYSTSVVAYRNGGTDAFATTTSKADGTFTLVVPPGAYKVVANPGGTPRCASVDTNLKLNTHVSMIVLQCDTSIR